MPDEDEEYSPFDQDNGAAYGFILYGGLAAVFEPWEPLTILSLGVLMVVYPFIEREVQNAYSEFEAWYGRDDVDEEVAADA